MNPSLRLTFNPYEGVVVRPALLTDWLELAEKGQQRCVDKMVKMCTDLLETGMNCRYLKWFGGAVGELKGRTSDGGARVYLFRIAENDFALTRAECKKEDTASSERVRWTLEVAALHGEGFDIFNP